MISQTGAVLGIDVGFSSKRRSSAICRLDWDDQSVRWTIDRFRADTADRQRAIKGVAGGMLVAAAAFDGPLRRGFDRIDRYRIAERMLTRRLWSQIGKPGQSNSRMGKMLNDAANTCVDAVSTVCHIGPATHAIRIDGDAIVEAFPNAFLGVMIEDPTCLSTLRGNRSDVYFEHLAGLLERILGHLLPGRKVASSIAKVTNHDDRAALVCALTALCVVASDFTAVGDNNDGWIILPPRAFVQNWAWRLLESNASEVETESLYSVAAR
jgi:predicted RNase H-like nuclease